MGPEIGSRLDDVRRLFRVSAHEDRPIAPTSSPVSSTELAARDSNRAPKLAVALLEAGDDVTVLLGGEAGTPEAGALEASLLSLSALHPRSVTFDLRELCFISSLAIGVLVRFRRAAVRRGVRVRLALDMPSEVRETMQTAGVFELFEVAGEPNHAPISGILIGGAGI
jgi:anti-anti-sigma factor